MADWLNIAGGAGAGYVQGTEDNRRREEFNAMQRQRLRVEKQQKEDEAIEAQLAKVPGAGTRDVTTYERPDAPLHETGLGVDPGKATTKKVTRTAAEADRERANVLAGSGSLRHLANAAQLRQNAYAAEAADRAERLAQKQEVLTSAGQMLAVGNHVAAARLLQKGYKDHVPDGHELQIEQGSDGSLFWGVVGPDGTWVQPPEKMTPQSVKQKLDQGIAMLSPELGFKAREVASGEKTAGAHETVAKTGAEKAAYETTGPGGQTDREYKQKHGIYFDKEGDAALMNARANQARAAAANTKQTAAEKAQDLIDTYVPIIKAANPGISDQQAKLMAAQVALRDPNAKTVPDQGLSEQGIFKVGGKLYRTGQKGQIEEVRLPGSTKGLAAGMSNVLGVGNDTHGSVTEPTSTFRSVPTPSVTSRSRGPVPISDTELDDWKPKLGKNVFGISTRNYVNTRTGETISPTEFEEHTKP